MPPLEQLGVFAACALIGLASAILGLGGGLFIVPLLSIGLDLPLRQAAGVGLVCTLTTSAAGSVALDKARLADLPLVTYLELAAATGAVAGATLAAHVAPWVVAGVFGLILGYAGWRMLLKARRGESQEEVPATWRPQRLGLGLGGCVLAGCLSGLLGIGGGPVKVPLQTEIMRVPLRVALANSNLMVGITAGAGVMVYFADGVIPVALVAPAALGIALGAYAGGRLAPRLRVAGLTYAFAAVLAFVSLRMLWKAATLAG